MKNKFLKYTSLIITILMLFVFQLSYNSKNALTVNALPQNYSVYIGGEPIGIRLNTKGVLIVALSTIETENGKIDSPAETSGIQIGDSIIKINNNEVNSSLDAGISIQKSQGKEIKLTIRRGDKLIERTLLPIKDKETGEYKLGIWIRDCTAGVGTLTYYTDEGSKFGALGHPITDADTGTILSINSGQILNSSIMSVKKGVRGNPGELRGIFINEETPCGKIEKNTKCGIFGTIDEKLIQKRKTKKIKVAFKDQIKEGKAQIFTTIDGCEPKYYDIVIEKLLSQDEPGPKSMIIRVTDQELLKKTGGIVQGMSGSPIVQDGKLVGAVTHVLINKPDVGYGVYIEWMLKESSEE